MVSNEAIVTLYPEVADHPSNTLRSAMAPRYGHSNIPIELFRSFVAISEHGSFTKAAKELNLTQPAISAQVKRLQQLVGGDLFVKKPTGVGLTELGLIVERYAYRILTLNDQVIALAGREAKHETIHLGIQSIFAQKLLTDVMNKFSVPSIGRYRFICGSALFLAEKLKSGYVDVVFMLAPTEPRRNVLAEWNEKLAWVCAPHHFPVTDGEPIPFVGRDNGLMDRKAMEILEDREVPYRLIFNAMDVTTLTAAVAAGIGVMVAPERVIPEPLIIARDRVLPKLPEMRAGVFFKEGFDLKRHRALAEAFVSVVQPAKVVGTRITRRS